MSTCPNPEARTNDLQLDSLPVHLDRLNAEVDAERGDEPWQVLIFVVPVQEGGLACGTGRRRVS